MARDRKINLVILGLLSHENLTGYEIKKRIDGAIGFFWKGSFGNIYPALSDMENAGLIEKAENDKPSGREKTIYRITGSGRDTLKEWLATEISANELKYETLLKVYFGGVTDKSVTLKNIELFEEQARKNLAILSMYRDNLKNVLDEEHHLNYYLTVLFGIESYTAQLKWCSSAKKLLKEVKWCYPVYKPLS